MKNIFHPLSHFWPQYLKRMARLLQILGQKLCLFHNALIYEAHTYTLCLNEPKRIWSARSWWLSGKESAQQCRRHRRQQFSLWVGKIPWRRAWQPTPVFLLGESYAQRSLVGHYPWGPKESDMTEVIEHHSSSCTGRFRERQIVRFFSSSGSHTYSISKCFKELS